MKPGPRYLGRAGGELAKERLSQYVRYAELVAEQEESLEAGDLERFEQLGELAAELREQIGSVGPEGPDGPDGLIDGPAEDVDHAARVLEEALAANGRIQDRLSRLRLEGADSIRRVERGRPQARRYMSDATETPPGRIDVKF